MNRNMPVNASVAPFVSASDLAEWQKTIGRTETRTEVLGAEPLRRFALATGAPDDVEHRSPPLGHWAFFPPHARDSEIGPDGHPRRGDFLPSVSLPRRMFAGGTIRFDSPLILGSEADQVSRIAGVSHKRGRSGDLVLVEVDRTIEQAGRACIRERQRYLYRANGPPIEMPVCASHRPAGEIWQPDEVNLFRFSAATFNGHRIHYDLPYAREAEGYPALVVQGPFTASRLAAFAMQAGSLAQFSFQARAPLFLSQPIYLRGAGVNVVEAVRCDGEVAMRADFVPA
ncbi:MaoC family dehydratase N-terminal domain-containing protein [Tsuneonella sp. YG55]|uniref:MaoC family dehydratase N-terminal domain-containing protein n=1 Tax=Tsuneonella litorea TaxID=2976475 RepID=A0A9X2W243_9SPHN|nr:MaoC family dehydratase N-terminal domain-containing protein [Tsuneonella litorea]MCT2559401.1 MaoC family dehydratase N-terminal domain-containing protein [Tsuneonella litorea]